MKRNAETPMQKKEQHSSTPRCRNKLRWLAYALILLGLIAGSAIGFNQFRDGKPEWSYYRVLAEKPLAESTGPEKMLFGYLPGCRAIVMPFVKYEPIGYILFALINVGACAAIMALIRVRFTPVEKRTPATLLWLAAAFSIPAFFTLQNNQMVAPAVLLSLCAFTFLDNKRDVLFGGMWALIPEGSEYQEEVNGKF